MKNLLVKQKCTRTGGRRKGLGVRLPAIVALVLLETLVGTELASAREAAPETSDTEQAVRWRSLVPKPSDSSTETALWTVGPTVLVEWGPVMGTELESLTERMDRIWTPLGRRWRAARSDESPQLTFESSGPEGESYVLKLSPTGARIQAQGSAGRFYALITLGQLLPVTCQAQEPLKVSTGLITDAPVYVWRGLMLDSSRHFQSISTLEWILELMAQHKLNRFHWHLTDDQGWRLPVPSWPLLTEVGGWRLEADGSRYGGAYTAEEIRHIVAFASRRQITVIPEVDLPGHSSAALAAYPELSASGLPRKVPLDWGVADGVLAIGRASVSRLTTDLLTTLTDLFPGPWIHWGGDEVYRSPWMRNSESLAWMRSVKATTADQAISVFWKELAQKTLSAGKIPMGWDDVSLHQPPAGTIVQWWDDPQRALIALKAGLPIVVSWKETTYLDYPELDSDGDRAFWMPVQTLNNIALQPFFPPGMPLAYKGQILGLEAGLWTERAPEPKLGRKLFPRLALVADLAWSGPLLGQRGWSWRLERHRDRLEAWGVGMPPSLR